MVHRPAAADHQDAAAARGGGGRRHQHQHQPQAQELVLRRLLPCNKGRACRFKRSCFASEEDDAAASAMLLLACVVCAPSSPLS
ncbi:hypothetical protein ACP70R_020624 [Stipagrostis hirtigluma subsp. patula]